VSNLASFLDMRPSGQSCSAPKAWAEAPTQPQPRRRAEAENEAATKPKTVPQGGVKDCCN